MRRAFCLRLLWVPLLAACAHPTTQSSPPAASPSRAWWKEVVVYQVYPRSFKDSDNNGVGDLRGIASRLNYIKSLGVNVVWLNPVYQSPNDDNGYDISDYRAIMGEMGSMADFDAMLQGMHRRGIKLVMDLVVNHTSDEHPWFRQSRSSRNSPYRDYYHWWPAEKGTPPKRWSYFDEEASAWRYDSATNAYYLHYFSRKQPDLNWENPRVRREVYAVMKYWFDKGVDGFRMDVIPFISKDTTFPALPAVYRGNYPAYYAKGPRLHEYLREMNREVLRKYDVMTVGEGGGVTVNDALKFVADDRHELQTFFQFEVVDYWGRRQGNFMYPDSSNRSLPALKDIFTRWDSVFARSGWGTVFLGNHDQSRMVSRFGNDAPPYRNSSAKMLHTLLLTMRATPYIYNGDEVGMANIRFRDIRDYRDLMTINYYNRLKKEGGDLREFLSAQAEVSRDNSRTPMQRTADTNAGFTGGAPWIRVNPDYRTVNIAAAERDTSSVLHYFRRMVRLRRSEPVLVYGKYQLLDRGNRDVFAYTRSLDGRTLMVALSFSPTGGRTALPAGHLMWHRVAPALAEEFTVVCADLRGYGSSGKPPSRPDHGPYSKSAMALDMVRMMEAQGFSRFSVAGHDRGARVAYRMALDHSDRIERLAVLDIIPTSEAFRRADVRFALAFWPWSLLAQPEPLPERLIVGDPEIVVDDALGEWGSDRASFPPQVRAAYIEALRDPEAVHAICEEYRAAATIDFARDTEDRGAGRRISCPMLALWSEGSALDNWYEEAGGPLGIWGDWAADVTGRPISGGHFFPEQNATETISELSSFFRLR